jgi:hypothetical protein
MKIGDTATTTREFKSTTDKWVIPAGTLIRIVEQHSNDVWVAEVVNEDGSEGVKLYVSGDEVEVLDG